jgi:hypothetical protein
MNELIESTPATPTAALDLASSAQRVLAASDEPMTVSKIRARLPGALRGVELTELTEVLERQVSANALYKYPKYRSQQDRYWDRGMTAHVAALLRAALEEGPLTASELRRKLPAYAQAPAPQVLDEQIAQGLLHRHPRAGTRGGERFGARPADPRDYLRDELPALFTRLASLGFGRPQIRAAALELLHEEEWDAEPEAPRAAEPPTEAEESAAETKESLSGPHAPAVLHGATHQERPDAAQRP